MKECVGNQFISRSCYNCVVILSPFGRLAVKNNDLKLKVITPVLTSPFV